MGWGGMRWCGMDRDRTGPGGFRTEWNTIKWNEIKSNGIEWIANRCRIVERNGMVE